MAKTPGKAAEPRPSYEYLTNELDRLFKALDTIISSGRDADGDLDDVQMSQAKASFQALKAGRISLECPQLFGPYASKKSRKK